MSETKDFLSYSVPVPLVNQKSHNNIAKEYRSASDLISKYILYI